MLVHVLTLCELRDISLARVKFNFGALTESGDLWLVNLLSPHSEMELSVKCRFQSGDTFLESI